MSKVTIDKAQNVLEGALDEAEDSEQKFRLRTVLQYLQVLQQQEEEVIEIVEEEGDYEVFSRLRELGYIQ